MKNSSRKYKSTGGSASAKKSGKGSKGGRSSAGMDAAEIKARKTKAAAESGKTLDVLYRVETKRDADVIKAYITFTYRVLHPGVTARLLLFGVLVAAPSILAKDMWLKIALLVVGGLMILLGLFRQYISLALTKRNDQDYRDGTDFTYEFTANDASFYRGDELTSYIGKYKYITAFYYDEDYYYLGINTRDFFILPKSRFTVGDPVAFEDFIYGKSKKACRWIPNNFRDQFRKWQAAHRFNADKMTRR